MIGKLITLEALPLVWYRLLIAAVCIAIYMWIKKISFKKSLPNIMHLFGLGAIIGLHWFFFFWAIKASNVSIALCTLSTGALFSALLEPLFFKRKIDLYEISISVVVIICMSLIFKLETRYSTGIILGIICTLFSVCFSILNTKYIRKHKVSPTRYSFYELIGALITITLIMGFDDALYQLENLSSANFLWLLILGALLTAFPMIESMDLLKKISPYTMLLTINLEPVYGIIIAYFVFPESEKMQLSFYLVVLVLVGSIILNEYLKHRLETKKKALLM